jgi:hypothetical protein
LYKISSFLYVFFKPYFSDGTFVPWAGTKRADYVSKASSLEGKWLLEAFENTKDEKQNCCS